MFKHAHIYNIIGKLGLHWQKSREIYSEADPASQKVFKHELKKLINALGNPFDLRSFQWSQDFR